MFNNEMQIVVVASFGILDGGGYCQSVSGTELDARSLFLAIGVPGSATGLGALLADRMLAPQVADRSVPGHPVPQNSLVEMILLLLAAHRRAGARRMVQPLPGISRADHERGCVLNAALRGNRRLRAPSTPKSGVWQGLMDDCPATGKRGIERCQNARCARARRIYQQAGVAGKCRYRRKGRGLQASGTCSCAAGWPAYMDGDAEGCS
jgi:hypothetical protein